MTAHFLSIAIAVLGFGQANGTAMERVSLDALLAATGGRAVGAARRDIGFDRVEIDSRTLRRGSLFWALRGERHNGHDFVADAFRKGAAACVVERIDRRGAGGPLIVVDSTLRALWDFACWHRSRLDALVVGVTGSVGKTTTREMIHATLRAGHTGTRSPHNFNNHVGVPLSLLDISAEHEFAVVELGASQVGEIRDLAGVAAPEVGVVTPIGAAHLESFGNEERILKAKGELIESLPKSGFAVLHGDCPNASRLKERAACPVLLVGEGRENQLRATHIETKINEISFRVDGHRYAVHATGRHHVGSALCAIAVAREVGIDEEQIAEGLRRFRPVAGRCRVEQIGPWTVIDDSYNANPSSMQAACELLGCLGGTRRLMVAADMLELGDRAEECHRLLGRRAAAAEVDHLLVQGINAEHVIRGAREAGMPQHRLAQFATLETMLAILDCWLAPGDVVLVKGSRAMQMERVVEWMRRVGCNTYKENTNRDPSRQCA